MDQLIINDKTNLTIDDVALLVKSKKLSPQLDRQPTFKEKITNNYNFLKRQIADGQQIYGVTTGLGSSSKNRFDSRHCFELQNNLVEYHGCGVGSALSSDECYLTLILRLLSLSRGRSAVSYDLLERLQQCLALGIIPIIPEKGSVGASGDLTPLSYLAAVLRGKRQVYYNNEVAATAAVFQQLDIKPYEFKEREALAIMNGTSVMTAITALALLDAKIVADLTCKLTGLMVELLQLRTSPFTAELNRLKPHKGQLHAAQMISSCIENPSQRLIGSTSAEQIQDSYSIRCAPQVIGVLYDVIDWAEQLIETEINAVNDNPVFLDDREQILNGGLFFGGHIAAAADALKTAVANVLNLVDRQLAVLMNPRTNGHLSENLVATSLLGLKAPMHHGFKAMQITMSSLTAECLKQSLPMSIFSRPTENSNQDVVSMGTIAARDLKEVINLAKDVIAIQALAIRQGFFINTENTRLNPMATEFLEQICKIFHGVVEDRELDHEIKNMACYLFNEQRLV